VSDKGRGGHDRRALSFRALKETRTPAPTDPSEIQREVTDVETYRAAFAEQARYQAALSIMMKH
jgi:hypothetical protein